MVAIPQKNRQLPAFTVVRTKLKIQVVRRPNPLRFDLHVTGYDPQFLSRATKGRWRVDCDLTFQAASAQFSQTSLQQVDAPFELQDSPLRRSENDGTPP